MPQWLREVSDSYPTLHQKHGCEHRLIVSHRIEPDARQELALNIPPSYIPWLAANGKSPSRGILAATFNETYHIRKSYAERSLYRRSPFSTIFSTSSIFFATLVRLILPVAVTSMLSSSLSESQLVTFEPKCQD